MVRRGVAPQTTWAGIREDIDGSGSRVHDLRGATVAMARRPAVVRASSAPEDGASSTWPGDRCELEPTVERRSFRHDREAAQSHVACLADELVGGLNRSSGHRDDAPSVRIVLAAELSGHRVYRDYASARQHLGRVNANLVGSLSVRPTRSSS